MIDQIKLLAILVAIFGAAAVTGLAFAAAVVRVLTHTL